MTRCQFVPINDAKTQHRCEVCGAEVRTSRPTEAGQIAAICGTIHPPAEIQAAIGAVGRQVDPQGPHGPGWHLHRIIKERTGEDFLPGCGCDDWVRQMDEWGSAACRGEHLEEIVDKMLAEAKRRGWRLDRAPLGPRLAARLARMAQKAPGGDWLTTKAARRVCRGMVLEACAAAEAEALASHPL